MSDGFEGSPAKQKKAKRELEASPEVNQEKKEKRKKRFVLDPDADVKEEAPEEVKPEKRVKQEVEEASPEVKDKKRKRQADDAIPVEVSPETKVDKKKKRQSNAGVQDDNSADALSERKKKKGLKSEGEVDSLDVKLEIKEEAIPGCIDLPKGHEIRGMRKALTPEEMFCQGCGGFYMLSNRSSEGLLVCHRCQRPGLDLTSKVELTVESETSIDFKPPPWLLDTKAFRVPKKVDQVEIRDDCLQCGNDKLQFWTRQTRSADEGQTVFYLCAKCGWRKIEYS